MGLTWVQWEQTELNWTKQGQMEQNRPAISGGTREPGSQQDFMLAVGFLYGLPHFSRMKQAGIELGLNQAETVSLELLNYVEYCVH